MRKERNEPKKEKHVELQQCFALQGRMDDVKIFCHPELAAKFVETKSKRDFMPLPGVSGSLNLYIKGFLNSRNFREPQRLMFHNDIKKLQLYA